MSPRETKIEPMFDIDRVEGMPPGPGLAQALLAVDVTSLDSAQTVCWLRAWERLHSHAEACRYAALAHYADLHPAEPEPDDSPSEESALCPGGDGTSSVGEFAIGDLAVALRCTRGRAAGLVGDALALRHRIPLTGARLATGEVSAYAVWQVLRAVEGTSQMVARLVDTRIAPMAGRVGPKRLEREVGRALMEVDPGEAERRARAAEELRHVRIESDAHGERRVSGYVSAFDGAAFDAALSRVADALQDLGDDRARDVLRSAAVGWLANPVAVLALIARHRAWEAGTAPLPWPTSSIEHTTDDDGNTHLVPGLWPMHVPTPHDLVDPDLWPVATVYLHIDRQTWLTQAGGAELAGHGLVTAEQAFQRLRHSRVTIKPVVDLDDEVRWSSASDTFDGGLREAVLLANRWNPFPYADAESRRGDDIDHTLPRKLGGETRIDNGGPLRRRLHRHKTFAKGWRVKQPFTGIFVWRSAEGRIYLVDRRGLTHDLGFGAAG